MSVTTIKAKSVVDTALALLEREILLPGTVWVDPVNGAEFTGKIGDAVTIRLPAYAGNARKNALRSGGARTRDSLHERSVDVSLDTRLYKDVEITDEVNTLDIVDFTKQVMSPVLRSLIQGLEDEVAGEMESATYAQEVDFDDFDNPLKALRRARKLLNNASVPMSQRYLAVGSDVEEDILNAQEFQENAARTGDETALRDAAMGRVAGFQPFVSLSLEPDMAVAYHRTAFALPTRAPKVPDGAPWGAVESRNGFSMRVVQVLDPDTINNILASEIWTGSSVVEDFGYINDKGAFIPGADPDNPATPADSASGAEAELFVRAVKLTSSGSA